MTAAVLATLGAPSLLVSNGIGEDEHGQYVYDWLQQRHVETGFAASSGVVTPQIIVAADDPAAGEFAAYLATLKTKDYLCNGILLSASAAPHAETACA